MSSYVTDRFRKDGAEVLARTIERKWRERGCKVTAWAEPITDMVAFDRLEEKVARKTMEPLYVVRSDMVNGLPQIPVGVLLSVRP